MGRKKKAGWHQYRKLLLYAIERQVSKIYGRLPCEEWEREQAWEWIFGDELYAFLAEFDMEHIAWQVRLRVCAHYCKKKVSDLCLRNL